MLLVIAEGRTLEELTGTQAEGGEIRFYLESALSDDKLQSLYNDIVSKGVKVTEFTQVSRILVIKGSPIQGIVESVKGINILGWQLLQEPSIPAWMWLSGLAAFVYLFRGRK